MFSLFNKRFHPVPPTTLCAAFPPRTSLTQRARLDQGTRSDFGPQRTAHVRPCSRKWHFRVVPGAPTRTVDPSINPAQANRLERCGVDNPTPCWNLKSYWVVFPTVVVVDTRTLGSKCVLETTVSRGSLSRKQSPGTSRIKPNSCKRCNSNAP